MLQLLVLLAEDLHVVLEEVDVFAHTQDLVLVLIDPLGVLLAISFLLLLIVLTGAVRRWDSQR